MNVTPIRPDDFKDPSFKCPVCKRELKVVTHPEGTIQRWCENKDCTSTDSWVNSDFRPGAKL